MSAMIDLLGQRFGRLTVVASAPSRRYGKKNRSFSFWQCRCDCGGISVVAAYNLRNGGTKSCGCLNAENARARMLAAHLVHGEARDTTGRTNEYYSWQAMIARCENANHKAYKRYGGRGIQVCECWRDDYQAFLADLGRKPSPQHSLDRIDNDGHYEPGNVRWATAKQQANNRSRGGEPCPSACCFGS